MAVKTCSSCHGMGSYTTTERIPNPAGGMFQEIQVRKTCVFCSGTGQVFTADKFSTSQSSSGRKASPSGPLKSPETILAELFSVIIFGLIVYIGFSQTTAEWYVILPVAFIIGIFSDKLLKGPLKFLMILVKYLIVVMGLGLVAYIISVLVKAG